MIKIYDTLYVTVAIDHGPNGSIGIRLPGYANRILVRADSKEDGGHAGLHGRLAWLLNEHAEDG